MRNKRHFLVALILATFCIGLSAYAQTGTITDTRDGIIYKTVKIGNQWWMAENLKTTKYSNGEDIPNVTDDNDWMKLKLGAYSNYDNDTANVTIYGRLYNGYSVFDDRGLCPQGWHVPTSDEWTILTNYLGGERMAAGKLRETGVAHWKRPYASTTNSSGFTALPNGCREDSGAFKDIGVKAFWWSTTTYAPTHALGRGLDYNNSYLQTYLSKRTGYSVRCIKD